MSVLGRIHSHLAHLAAIAAIAQDTWCHRLWPDRQAMFRMARHGLQSRKMSQKGLSALGPANFGAGLRPFSEKRYIANIYIIIYIYRYR